MHHRQDALLVAIDRFTEHHGFSPSLRDLMAMTDLTTTSMTAHHLRALANYGYITYVRGIARSIRITPQGRLWLQRRAAAVA